MNGEKMKTDGFLSGESSAVSRLAKLCAGLVGGLSICVSAQVAAQVCEAEIAQSIISFNRIIPSGTDDTSSWAVYGSRAGYDRHFIAWNSETCRRVLTYGQDEILELEKKVAESVRDRESNIQQYGANHRLVHLAQFSIDRYKFLVCGRRANVARCSSSAASASPSSGVSDTNRTSSTNPPSANLPAGSTKEVVALRQAVALAQKRQADVDRARQGKPKRHIEGAVAHNCLKPQKGGGVINECPYAVEYAYCAYHPTKDSWSEAFDCEKSKGGSWQVGPGPNARSIMHTGGEMTYWFACKYGETLHKPDGISPADIHFQRGRGLLGRCAEWGSKSG